MRSLIQLRQPQFSSPVCFTKHHLPFKMNCREGVGIGVFVEHPLLPLRSHLHGKPKMRSAYLSTPRDIPATVRAARRRKNYASGPVT
jgi:hypothetical protein